MSSPQARRRSISACSRLGLAALAAAMTTGAAMASPNGLPPVDALSTVLPSTQSPLAPGRAAGIGGHTNEQLGVPKLLMASDKLPKRAGTLQVAADPAGVARTYL